MQADGYVPLEALEALAEWLEDIEHRHRVEKVWANYMRAKRWLKVVAHGTWVEIIAYPGHPTEFRRELNFMECPCWIDDADITIRSDAVIEIDQGQYSKAAVAMSLPSLLWED